MDTPQEAQLKQEIEGLADMIAEIQALDAKLQDKISRLQAQLPSLNATIAALTAQIGVARTFRGHKIAALEARQAAALAHEPPKLHVAAACTKHIARQADLLDKEEAAINALIASTQATITTVNTQITDDQSALTTNQSTVQTLTSDRDALIQQLLILEGK